MNTITMNQKFQEMFGLPPDTVAATLAIRPGMPPCLTVTRMIWRTGQIAPTRQSDRFRLVPAVGASEGNCQGQRDDAALCGGSAAPQSSASGETEKG